LNLNHLNLFKFTIHTCPEFIKKQKTKQEYILELRLREKTEVETPVTMTVVQNKI